MNALIQNFTQLTTKADEFVCACCGDACHMDDHMLSAPENAQPTEEHAAAVIEKYGELVCVSCADSYEPEAGDYINSDETYDLWAEGAV